MEQLSDRIFWMLVGGIIGLIIGYFVRDVREMKREVHDLHENTGGAPLTSTPKNDADNLPRMRFLSFQGVALGVVVIITAYAAFIAQAAYNSDKNSARDQLISQCQGGVDSRKANREIVDAIYDLAIGAIQRDKDSPPLTAAEVKQYNAYIDRVNAFRTRAYSLIKPSEVCAPYVKDDKVVPSTPDQPHLVPR